MLLQYTADPRNPLVWHEESRMFSIEASDLPNHDTMPMSAYAHKVITIRVPAPGTTTMFFENRVVRSVLRDADNDVMFWEYKAYDGSTLRVYNSSNELTSEEN
jgi:hypothetical protein